MKIRTAVSAALLATPFVMADSMAIADGFIDRNEHGYTLALDHLITINGGWTGDANLSIFKCPRAACFYLSRPVKLPLINGNNEGYFAVTGLACDLAQLRNPTGNLTVSSHAILFPAYFRPNVAYDGLGDLPKGAEESMRQYNVVAKWDSEAKVWFAESSDIPGLVTEAETLERLIERITAVTPELLALNNDTPDDGAEVIVRAERRASLDYAA